MAELLTEVFESGKHKSQRFIWCHSHLEGKKWKGTLLISERALLPICSTVGRTENCCTAENNGHCQHYRTPLCRARSFYRETDSHALCPRTAMVLRSLPGNTGRHFPSGRHERVKSCVCTPVKGQTEVFILHNHLLSVQSLVT